jgi:hypothetical protein
MTGKEIAEAINRIIKEIDRDKTTFNEAINWGDLSVVSVDEIRQICPIETGYTRVVIEEASPDCVMFCAYIADEFRKKYGIALYVETEC